VRVRWSVDDEAVAAVWEVISQLTPAEVPARAGDWILDLGGGNGDFASSLGQYVEGVRITSVDVDRGALERPLQGVRPVRGDALELPFADGAFAAVAARAVLHHVPDDLADALRESRRVLAHGGRIVIKEPCSNNAIANLARRLFLTERHEEGERPLDADALVTAVGEAFRIREVRRHFVFSYLMPHLVGRAPPGLRGLLKGVALALARLDEDLIRGSASMRNRCAYITVVGEKARPDASTIDK
jgi:ubiquinone/menaquinone biosynthesis C-methylase UbiE